MTSTIDQQVTPPSAAALGRQHHDDILRRLVESRGLLSNYSGRLGNMNIALSRGFNVDVGEWQAHRDLVQFYEQQVAGLERALELAKLALVPERADLAEIVKSALESGLDGIQIVATTEPDSIQHDAATPTLVIAQRSPSKRDIDGYLAGEVCLDYRRPSDLFAELDLRRVDRLLGAAGIRTRRAVADTGGRLDVTYAWPGGSELPVISHEPFDWRVKYALDAIAGRAVAELHLPDNGLHGSGDAAHRQSRYVGSVDEYELADTCVSDDGIRTTTVRGVLSAYAAGGDPRSVNSAGFVQRLNRAVEAAHGQCSPNLGRCVSARVVKSGPRSTYQGHHSGGVLEVELRYQAALTDEAVNGSHGASEVIEDDTASSPNENGKASPSSRRRGSAANPRDEDALAGHPGVEA